MGEPREFHIGDVLAITAGILTRDIAGIYDILNFMTNDNLFTHQLPRAAEECKPWLLRQHPQLADVVIDDIATGDVPGWTAWLGKQVARFGESFAVEPIPRDDHSYRDPVAELEGMVGKDRVIVVEGSAPPQVQE